MVLALSGDELEERNEKLAGLVSDYRSGFASGHLEALGQTLVDAIRLDAQPVAQAIVHRGGEMHGADFTDELRRRNITTDQRGVLVITTEENTT